VINDAEAHVLNPKFHEPLYEDASGWTLTELRTTAPLANQYVHALERIIKNWGTDPRKIHQAAGRIYYEGFENWWMCSFAPNGIVTRWHINSQISLKYITHDNDTLLGKTIGWFFANEDQFTQKERQVISNDKVEVYFEMPNSYFYIKRTPGYDDRYLFFFKMPGLSNAKEIVKGSCFVSNIQAEEKDGTNK